MLERLRFLRYALRFERAFKTDAWEPVKACFHADARYVIEGGGSKYDGEYRGPDEIARIFKRMLDEFDRKFERRKPGLRSWPRVRDGELWLAWKATYVARTGQGVLTGESRCRFSGGKIIELRDTSPDGDWNALAKLVS